MKARLLSRLFPTVVVAIGLFSWVHPAGTPGSEGAQEPDPKQKFVKAQKANAAALRKYTWKSRTEMTLKGETKMVKVEQVVFDASGQQQKTLLEQSPKEGEQQGGGGGRLKKKMIAKKKKEMSEMLQNLAKLVTSYAHIPPEQMQSFMKNALFGMGQGTYEGTIKVTGQNAVQAGDTMSFWIDKQSFMMRRVEIDTALEKKPVHVLADYESAPNGPTYQFKATLEYPKEKIQVVIENFDYQPLAPAAAAGSQAQQAPFGTQSPTPSAQANTQQSQPPSGGQQIPPEQLDKLLAPIALYPDALIGQILNCSLSPFQVSALSDWLSANSNLKGSEVQEAAQKDGFDPSFVALAIFPQVVNMMAQQLDWTKQLGQAFGSDRKGVFDSIQYLRKQAQDVGNLVTSPQQEVQTVTTDSGQQVIVIQPANPQVIYVPQYNPQVVYISPPPQPAPATTTVVVQESSGSNEAAAALIGFTAGVIIGAMASDNYYYGPYSWRGGAGMYNEARRDYYDHRENMSENRQDNTSERQGNREQNVNQRQTNQGQNQAPREATRSENQSSRSSAQSSRQESASSRSSSYSSRGYGESGGSSRSSAFFRLWKRE